MRAASYLDPESQRFYVDWDQIASYSVAMLHVAAGRNPHDRDLTNLIGELATASEDFRIRWATPDLHEHQSGVKKVHHDVVGDMDLIYESLSLPGEPALSMFIYTDEPGKSLGRCAATAGSVARALRSGADRWGAWPSLIIRCWPHTRARVATLARFVPHFDPRLALTPVTCVFLFGCHFLAAVIGIVTFGKNLRRYGLAHPLCRGHPSVFA